MDPADAAAKTPGDRVGCYFQRTLGHYTVYAACALYGRDLEALGFCYPFFEAFYQFSLLHPLRNVSSGESRAFCLHIAKFKKDELNAS